MAYLQTQMLYEYKWSVNPDQDNTNHALGDDDSVLDRNDGNEMVYFINHLAAKHWTTTVTLGVYQEIEKLIKLSVPEKITTHKQIEDWLVAHWSNK